MLTVEKRIISRNFTRAGAGRKIEYIVIHYFGSLGTAAAVANYFAGADRQASAHYCLDEGNIVYQCVEDNNIAWHCGTSGGYVHPRCRNAFQPTRPLRGATAKVYKSLCTFLR